MIKRAGVVDEASTARFRGAHDGGVARDGKQVEWITDAAQFNQLSGAWSAFLERVGTTTVFDTHAWLQAVLGNTDGRAVRVAVIREGDVIRAALPLTVGREWANGVWLRSARIAGYPWTDRFTPLVDANHPELFHELLDAACVLDIDAFFLNEVVDDNQGAGRIRDWIEIRGVSAMSRLASVVRFVSLTATTPQEQEATYKGTYRRSTRKSFRLLSELGALEFEMLRPTPAEIPALVDRLKRVEDVAWQGQQGTGLFSSSGRRTFSEMAFTRLAAENAVAVCVMQIDGEDTMYLLGMVHREVFYWYSTAYVPDRIVGTAFAVLLHEFMPALKRAGVTGFDSSRNTPGQRNVLDRLDHRLFRQRTFVIYTTSARAWLHRRALVTLIPIYRAAKSRLGRPLTQGTAWVEEPDAPEALS